jgi:peptide/nickel transport system permease protein
MTEKNKKVQFPEEKRTLSDDQLVESLSSEEHEELGFLSFGQLIWRRFRRNKVGLTAAIILLMFYLIALFQPFLSPYYHNEVHVRYRHMPPQLPRFSFSDGFFIYGAKSERDPVTRVPEYTVDKSKKYPIELFYKDSEGRRHLFGSDGPMFLLGTERKGRDMLSLIIRGSRVSLTIGLMGVLLSLIFGAVLGTASGYFGGWIDIFMQRLIELLSAFPSIPLWMALAAAMPNTWNSMQRYFAITVILSLISWRGLARQIRGMVLSYRERDFVAAAKVANAGHWRIILKHLLPGCYSHIIVVSTLAVPRMIISETSLSFLGLGIQEPMVSWGVLLEEAQRVTVLLKNPWLLFPAIPVLIVVISFNFMGDALRDAADPYT